MKKLKPLSKARIRRMRIQGYTQQSEEELSKLAFANRFTASLCTLIMILGVVTVNFYVLGAMLVIAVCGVVLPNHPFDYIYNYLLAKKMGRPRLPKRSDQLKFACTIASVWLTVIIFLFHQGYTLAGYINGILMISVATLVSTTDYCIPSVIYKALVVGKWRKTAKNTQNTI